jgi:flavodoxin
MKLRGATRIAAGLVMAGALLGCGSRPDSVSGASMQVSATPKQDYAILPGQPVIVTPSDHGGAARLASAIAARLGACVVSPAAVTVGEIQRAGLLGLGSGIFDQAHHKALLDLAEALPPAPGRKVFIFSTSGVSREKVPGLDEEDPHRALRERLIAKGSEIVGEFNCAGYNDNSFLFLIGGMNKGHPNAKDIALAEAFADSLLQGGAK